MVRGPSRSSARDGCRQKARAIMPSFVRQTMQFGDSRARGNAGHCIVQGTNLAEREAGTSAGEGASKPSHNMEHSARGLEDVALNCVNWISTGRRSR